MMSINIAFKKKQSFRFVVNMMLVMRLRGPLAVRHLLQLLEKSDKTGAMSGVCNKIDILKERAKLKKAKLKKHKIVHHFVFYKM